MAPVLPHDLIPDLKFSSLELDARSTREEAPGTSLARREVLYPSIDNPLLPRSDDASPILSPADTYNLLTARDSKSTNTPNPAAGSVDPNDINMQGIQALIAIIGAAMVLGAIWFFFWAKNGGFKWRKGDWDEYKSTVLRRKGPNGTTLSNATKSTKLGGGSVVGDGYSDKDSDSRTDGTMTEAMTETMTVMSSEAPIMKEKQSKKKKETAKERKLREQSAAPWEGGHDNDVRAYRHEKPARVGGLNKDSDAQFYGTDYSETDRTGSDVYSNSNRQSSNQHSPEKRQSHRDFSYSQETSFSVETPPPPPAHSPSPAPRPARYHSPEKNRSPQRPIRQVPGSIHVPGSFAEPLDFDVQSVQSQNTKTYHHPLPSLSGQQQPRPGGYRRDRRNSLDD